MEWSSKIADDVVMPLESAADKYLHLLREAVRERCRRGKVAAHLSGGMDSSTVVCLARDVLAAQGNNRLTTLSLDYLLPGLRGEDRYMQMILDQGGPIDPVMLREEAALDYDGFQTIPAHDEPHNGIFRYAMEQQMMQAAHARGVTTILTGGGAETIVAEKQTHLADRARQGRWLTLLREARRWSRARNMSLARTLWDHALAPLTPAVLRHGPGVWMRGGYGRWPNLGLFSVAPWILPFFNRRHRVWGRCLDSMRSMNRYPVQKLMRDFELFSTGSWSSWHLGAPLGIQLSDPFLDPRLLCFGLGLAPQVRENPRVRDEYSSTLKKWEEWGRGAPIATSLEITDVLGEEYNFVGDRGLRIF